MAITMLQLVKVQVETALFFESVEQIYARVFRSVRPRTSLPAIHVRFRKYANANGRVRLQNGVLAVDLSDLFDGAPAPIQESLALILISKLFRSTPDASITARYRRYLNRPDVRRTLQRIKQERGRKVIAPSRGKVYDLCEIFEELNFRYFNGLMARPTLGWSRRPSRTILGHYDPSHNTIVLTSLLDSVTAPLLVVQFVMFHEMLHLRFPAEHRGAKRCVHTPEFKKAERGFDAFDEAQKALRLFLEAG